MDSSNTMIRHSGRALIRGKIRRVWRPRYLELCDNGLVRYYELNTNGNGNAGNNNNVIIRNEDIQPKYTLIIFHARIIDVTTLRDMHVGLPMGSYGFVFHGQQGVNYSIGNMTEQQQCHPIPEHAATPRDFLCAVDTLEEAQSWVVALQWAAMEKRRDEDEWQEQDDDFYVNSSSSRCSTDAFQVVCSTTATTAKQPQKTMTTTTVRSSTSQNTKKQKKTVVTKVRSLQLVRIEGWWHWELAYVIHMLLLQQQQQRSQSSVSPGQHDLIMVEERTIVRTLEDIRTMLMELEQEATNPKSLQVLQQVSLPTIMSTYSDHVASLPHIEQMLRTLAMNVHFCNSQSMRSFWSLSVDTNSNASRSSDDGGIWSRSIAAAVAVHDPKGLFDRRNLPSPQNTKDFVQAWLQKDPKDNSETELEFYVKSGIVWLLQRPLTVVGALAVPAVMIVPLVYVLYKQWMVSIRVRLDFLVVSWAVSAFLGREYERRELQTLSIPALLTRQQRQTIPSTDSMFTDTTIVEDVHSVTSEEEVDLEEEEPIQKGGILSSPLPEYPSNGGDSCWSKPENDIFRVRGATYLQDRIKIPSAPAPFVCRGVDIWLTDNPERHIARHPRVLGGKLGEEESFVVNFLLPFGNFVAYFGIPPLHSFPSKLAHVWTKFLQGDQQYRDARLKLLPVVVDGPWIVRTAVGPGTSPALLGKVIPLQYYFRAPTETQKGVYEVDVIITASRIAKGILSVVKGHTKMLTMAFAFIIEAAEEEELPETVLCTFQMHSIHLEDCPRLPECNLDEIET